MKVRIERESCTMCAVCWASCPEVFEEGPDDGSSQIVEQYRIEGQVDQGEVPDTLSDCVTDAADGCPAEVIHLE
jgi:ferredoxin